ncbi:hypothetical protein D7B24_005503 [Verticillium nonalfalfae]|uniref:DUF7605 domain-containing protein n=1 Tax=Verticillium nonalfalfae TaxID=1051616 RepID=A0A3M9YCC9_9PEZI|nr:uncharacterized protein D7B24_005503 [Verticillium nonalfalfae]RNJ57861.1 hypothetical protein D7B24_005503 [Verticillium nonalfalfae]
MNLSGIPALRRHCIGLVADAQSREVLNYIQKDIPALISELDIWVQNGAGTLDAERRRAIREVVNAVEHGIQSALNKNSSRIRTISSLANATFESKVYKDQHIERWVEGAVQASRVWHGWAPMTYKMFCGNFGYHSTPKQAVQSWNHQAMHTMTLDLSTRWRDFKLQLEGYHARVLDTVNSVQADAVQKIDDELSEFPASIATVLGEVVSRRIQLLAEDIERHYTTLLEDLWILETNALTGIRTSIFGKAMESSYDQANADSGSGSDQRRKAVIRETLSRDMLFKDHMTQFRQGFRKHTSKWRVSLADALDHRLSELSVTFDMIRQDHAAREGDQDPQFRNRLATELSNSKTEMRRINAMVGF